MLNKQGAGKNVLRKKGIAHVFGTTHSNVTPSSHKAKITKAKPITAVCVEYGVKSVPKDKGKLRKSGMMKMCLLSPLESYEEIQSRINQLFGKPVKLLLVTKSGDLFNAPTNLKGNQFLE